MKLSAFVGVASAVFAAMLATAAPNAAPPALVDMTFDLDLNGMSSGTCPGGVCCTVEVKGDTKQPHLHRRSRDRRIVPRSAQRQLGHRNVLLFRCDGRKRGHCSARRDDDRVTGRRDVDIQYRPCPALSFPALGISRGRTIGACPAPMIRPARSVTPRWNSRLAAEAWPTRSALGRPEGADFSPVTISRSSPTCRFPEVATA
jgi:hypothetical protein